MKVTCRVGRILTVSATPQVAEDEESLDRIPIKAFTESFSRFSSLISRFQDSEVPWEINMPRSRKAIIKVLFSTFTDGNLILMI